MNLPTYTSGILFTKAHKRVRALVYSELEKYQLNPTYWAILGATAYAPEGIRLSNVAALMGVKAPVVTTESNELIKRDLIRRIPHHTDGRAKLLVITQKGKIMAQEVEDDLNKEVGSLFVGLTPKEVATFQKALQLIVDNAKQKA